MPIKFNPITGNLDLIGDKILPNGTVAPVSQQNGYVSLAQVASDGRFYFFVNGKRYYISGVTDIEPPLGIQVGQPVGLMGVTYANSL